MTPAEYSALGYVVFPCTGKRPARCSTWPNDQQFVAGDNIGLVVPVGAVVIDLDRKPDLDGVAELAAIAPDGWHHDGPLARTGGGGAHLWFRVSPLLGLGNGRGTLPRGIDVRGGGKGYVIAPPSTHESGGVYQWRRPLVPVPELPELPAWLLDRLLATPEPAAPRPTAAQAFADRDLTPYLQAALDAEAAAVRDAPEGTGNEQINRSAFKLGGLQAHGLRYDDARGAIEGAISGWSWRNPRDRAAALRTFESGWRAGESQPRPAPPDRETHRSADPGRARTLTRAATRDGAAARAPRDRPVSKGPPAKPEIRVTTDEPAVNDAAIEALAAADYPDLYQRAGELVRVVRYAELPTQSDGIPQGQPVVAPMARATLQERLAGSAQWVKYEARTELWKPTHPPTWSVAAVYQRGSWPGIYPLRGIADYPLIRADGTMQTAPGYDEATGFYVASLPEGLEIPEAPTRDDARAAADRLLELVCDFPLVDDTDRAAWLAYLLTPLARAIIQGPTPLFVADATVRGTGKTLLLSVPGWILTGRDLPAQTYSVDDAELEKVLVSVAVLALPLLCFDNVTATIGGGVLDKWLTSTTPTGRILGRSEVVLFDWTTTLAVTSNNAAVSGDTDRRAIYLKQQTAEERPELRQGFRFDPLRDHVLAHRGALLSDALTILRAYQIAGRPRQQGRPKGSFEAWCRAVRDPLLWLGLADAERAPDDPARPVDSDTDELAGLLVALRDQYGGDYFTVGEMLDDAFPSHDMISSTGRALREVLASIPYKGEKPSRQMLGRRLQRYRDRWLNGLTLISERDSKRKMQIWRIAERELAGSAGSSRVVLHPTREELQDKNIFPGRPTTAKYPHYPPADNEQQEVSFDE